MSEPKSSSERTTNLRELMTPDPVFHPAPYYRIDGFLAPMRVDHEGNLVPVSARPWEGIAPKKPWEYRITAGIVHLDQYDMLECVIETLRLQTERPFIHVVDTGSDFATREKLTELEISCDDVRVDYLHPRGWSQTSAPVSTAMDLIFASVDYGVDFCYSTHVDCFLRSRKYLSYLTSKCDAMTPVVGYRMSPRKMTDLWRIIPSHTATMFFMPTMREIRACWSMHYAAQRLGLSPEAFRNVGGWPDTESALGLILNDCGIKPRELGEPPRSGPSWLCLGEEKNEPYSTPWLRHERSFTSQSLYAREYAERRKESIKATMEETWERIARWKAGKME
jgi:hypothetical protein